MPEHSFRSGYKPSSLLVPLSGYIKLPGSLNQVNAAVQVMSPIVLPQSHNRRHYRSRHGNQREEKKYDAQKIR
jgi:hypothetical protein